MSFHDMRQGQAARTHVLGLYEALLARGWEGPLLAASPADASSAWTRLRRYVTLLVAAHRAMTEVDVLYVRSHPVAVLLLPQAMRRGVKVIVEVNGTVDDLRRTHPATRRISGLLALAERALLGRSDGIVTVSDQLAAWIRAVAPTVPMTVVPNAADPRIFRPTATTCIPVPAEYVAFCGALAEWQGIEVVLEATRTSAWPPRVFVLIAGDGGMTPLVAREASHNRAVQFVGVVEQAEVAGILAGSLAGLSPNTRRTRTGNAMKMYEALACGVPLVASDVDGQREFVTSQDVGVVYRAEDPEALAEAVRRLASDDDERSRLAGRATRVARAHSWKARAAQVDEFVTDL